MLLDAGVLCVIVGLLAGGRPARLLELELRAPWAFVVAALMQIALMGSGTIGWQVGDIAGGCLHVASYLLLLLGLWLNRHLWGMRLAAIGVLLNLLVIGANGGSMPVDRELAVRAGNRRLVEKLDSPGYWSYRPATGETRLRALADVLPLPLLYPRPRFFSPGSVGDVFVTIGGCWLILSGLGAFRLGRKRQQAG